MADCVSNLSTYHEAIGALHPSHWGLGIATELVQLSLTVAFRGSNVPEVRAFAMPENVASARVLEKCGFNFLRFEPSLERNHFLIRNTFHAASGVQMEMQ